MDASIQQLITDAESEKVQQVLTRFNSKDSKEVNVEIIVAEFQHKDLSETITYLKTKVDKYQPLASAFNKKISAVKGPVASDIWEFLDQLRPIECQACHHEYVPVSTENAVDNEVSCQICNKISHKACYDSSIVNPDIGIYYVCNLCSINFKQFKAAPVADKEHTETEAEPVHDVDPARENRPNVRQNQNPNERDHFRDDIQICPQLLEARCPHGLRGEECSFFHPKSCYYYSKHGNDPHLGCRKGNRCKFFHPKLCSNSENLKICLNEQCKLVHLKGTQRRQPRYPESGPQLNTRYPEDNAQQNTRYQERNGQQITRPPIAPWDNSRQIRQDDIPYQQQQSEREMRNKRTMQPEQREVNRDLSEMQSFLERCLEKMKSDISKQIDEKIDSKFLNTNQQIAGQWHRQEQTQVNRQPHVVQLPPEPSHQKEPHTTPVSFMGYPPMVFPQVPQNAINKSTYPLSYQ